MPHEHVSKTIWTIGHWTCPPEQFLQTIEYAGIDLVADVRALPGSRRSPQFNADQMQEWLEVDGIGYVQLPLLAGRRRRQPEVDPTLNAGWQNASFKNYADYTQTADYEQGIDELTELASTHHVAILCGEPMPWRCHRLLVSNTLTARGWQVEHLITTGKPRKHQLGMWGADAVNHDGVLTYPAEGADCDEQPSN
ncbi:DUF488 family protein [Aestuariimicrobium sp. p3-SID1156]|uniref:DUF488 domain-containing protein n=1 Tax=Aestuariimicrobium sp. p3-SID1156 TaxID=2916038 RepID=UPI00223B82B8|nr:DUF488 domain-containing protein [Aestuariimicrobium sp. p3-SID1156]